MRTRLRPAYAFSQMDAIYAEPHRHENFADHIRRVDETVELGFHAIKNFVDIEDGTYYIADLSCGDAHIPRRLAAPYGDKVDLILGDYAPGYALQGSISTTIGAMKVNKVHTFVCCETAEHVDNPDAMLAMIRQHAGTLLFSTPIGNHDDTNPEHLWAWDRGDVQDMLRDAGFVPTFYTEFDPRGEGYPYCWGIWFCA